MPGERLYREIQNLERKIQLMLSENKGLKEELSQSKEENGVLKDELKNCELSLSNFQNQMKISKLVNNMVAEGENSSELKKMLDSYIREIDKCIAHLAE